MTETTATATGGEQSGATLTVKASDNGSSFYVIPITGVAKLSSEADRPGNAEHPDKIVKGDNTNEYDIHGYVGEGGVDSYYLYSNEAVGVENDGDAVLHVYINGTLCQTVKPNTTSKPVYEGGSACSIGIIGE